MDAVHALPLPGTLDRKATSELARSLLELRGSHAALDGAGVERLGALAVEALISARKQWQVDGRELRITNPSPAFLAALEALGADLDMLQTGPQT
ncbi:STAS domain-containing protein [Paracoccus gahaiensis]|uniref:STAS domain-containing protein n=1 Tax=Paracoccus gahaiensis TaxID=1706839 RepID=A0A4U0RQ45_9RHOB|nr:STAS domain-containing protein [Paracoccus gahaiensis]